VVKFADNFSRRVILKIELELNNLNSILSRSAVTPVFPSPSAIPSAGSPEANQHLPATLGPDIAVGMATFGPVDLAQASLLALGAQVPILYF